MSILPNVIIPLQACRLYEHNIENRQISNYYIKAAAILTPELVNQGKFQEWVIESNRGNEFRVFYDRDQAETWLIGD